MEPNVFTEWLLIISLLLFIYFLHVLNKSKSNAVLTGWIPDAYSREWLVCEMETKRQTTWAQKIWTEMGF